MWLNNKKPFYDLTMDTKGISQEDTKDVAPIVQSNSQR